MTWNEKSNFQSKHPQSCAKWLTLSLAIICAFSLVFNEIALPLLIPPSPFSMLSMLDHPIDFVAATTVKWGGGVKENKDVRD